MELALQMARSVTHNIPVLSLTNSYHGSYGTAMADRGGKACRHDLPECGGIYHVQVSATTYMPSAETQPRRSLPSFKTNVISTRRR